MASNVDNQADLENVKNSDTDVNNKHIKYPNITGLELLAIIIYIINGIDIDNNKPRALTPENIPPYLYVAIISNKYPN